MIIQGERGEYLVKVQSAGMGADVGALWYPVVYKRSVSKSPLNVLKKGILPGQRPKWVWTPAYTAKMDGKVPSIVEGMNTAFLQAWFYKAVREYEERLQAAEEGLAARSGKVVLPRGHRGFQGNVRYSGSVTGPRAGRKAWGSHYL